ncbi:hypothetical protein HP550_19915 [Cellulomonas humilata]|uniref:Uncharacterized protein n=1 Tax=Cellulomonas humilata TaxID=144055 RepID=A0A7Y6DYE0_9CELL|nr:hypothetical protein [Cellulomonas humilata]NUU19521.1 hypothetical protein [Cellulomonas humilata]
MLGTGGIAQWIQDNVVPLILIVIAIGVLWAGNAGNISKAVTKIGVSLVGIAFLAMVVSGSSDDVGQWLVSLVHAG